jgi:nitrile hydratase accessory protein
MASTEMENLPGLPLDEKGPVFSQPWEARAFSLACKLLERGVFTPAEWAEQLGKTIQEAQSAGDPDLGDTYYQHWLKCLETLTLAKGLATREKLEDEKLAAHEAHQQLHASLGHHSH